MERNLHYEAIVLKITKMPEGHALVDFLLKEQKSAKHIRAFFYGLQKTKKNYGLRQFQSGKLWLYFNPIKNSYKVIDFQVTEIRPGLSESLIRVCAASFACELALKTHGNIDFLLFGAFLDGISRSSDEACKLAFLRFLWRFINYSGLAPQYELCTACGKNFIDENVSAYFEKSDFELYCRDCIDKDVSLFFVLSPESLRFLTSIDALPASESRKIVLSEKAYRELHAFLLFLVQGLLGERLKTLELGLL